MFTRERFGAVVDGAAGLLGDGWAVRRLPDGGRVFYPAGRAGGGPAAIVRLDEYPSASGGWVRPDGSLDPANPGARFGLTECVDAAGVADAVRVYAG